MGIAWIVRKLETRVRVARTAFLWRFCRAFECLGVHVMPVHYYSPLPPRADLPDSLFERLSDCVGVDWNAAGQQRYLKEVFPTYAREVEFERNAGLSVVDAAILHAMIRHHKPKKIVEIGSGASTRFSARACVMNAREGHESALIAIEPYPGEALRAGFPGLTRLIEAKVQDVALDEVADADLVFIDSSHVVRIGGDVIYEILEIVPRLKTGALVHWHDIVLPGEYWKDWVKGRNWFFAEQYLLHAFLQFNREFEIVWASRYMHLKHAEAITKVFPYFQPDAHRITSFWVRRIAPGSGRTAW